MIRIEDLQYIRLGTDDLERAVSFATGTLGLEIASR